MLTVLAAAVALAGWFYRRVFGRLPRAHRRSLFLLRAVAIAIVVLLLFRPVLSFEREATRPRALVLLVDSSASMNTADDASGKTRFEQARARAVEWSGRLGRDFDVKVGEFSDRAALLERPGDLARVKPSGTATSLTRALQAAATAAPAADVAAVVLFTDGVHNAAGDPVANARSVGLVVHTVGVGNSLRDSPSYRDVRINGLECPEQLPLNNRATVTAHLGQTGLAGELVKVSLDEDGTVVDSAEVELKGGETTQDVPFQFTPSVRGRHTYTVRVPPVPGEKFAENNLRSAAAVVVDSRIRILYIEGTLRAEYGALVQRFLSKDPDLDFCALVQTRPNVFLERTNFDGPKLAGIPTDPAVLQRFDVFLIGDLDATYWKGRAMAALVERVRGGAGLIMVGGYHSLGPGGYAGTPLEPVLPVFVGARGIGQLTDPFLPELTPDGRAHPIFTNIAGFFPAAGAGAAPQDGGLPLLDGCTRVEGARPGATVLAVHPKSGGGRPMPVLAVQPFGKGRAAAFSADTTRNWQQGPRALDRETPFLRFWGQVVRWLANRTEAVKAEAGVTARADKASYQPDEAVGLVATVRDDRGEGTGDAEVSAQVGGPGGKVESVALYPSPGSTGNYGGTFQPKRSGAYRMVVAATLGRASLRSEPFTVEVGRPNLEFDRVDLDEATLVKVAAATGGRYRHVSTADRLIEDLDRRERRSRVAFEQPLAFPAPCWALFVAVLTAEWILRKGSRLR